MRSLALVLPLALVLTALFASSARAEGATNTVEFSCTAITFNYSEFPNLPNNRVTQLVYVDGTLISTTVFVFNGPTGSDTVKVSIPPGHHTVDARTKWNTNGVTGGKDIPAKGGLTCVADPSFSIEKLQKTAGTTQKYTTATLPSGKPGQTIEYEIVVKNTGNVTLTFSNFTDPKCDEGTITGPTTNPVPAGGKTFYFCKHLLTLADREVGFYTNTATDTGTSEENTVITHESNTVVVELPINPTNTVEFSCTAVTFNFTNFPNAPNNTVTEYIYVDGKLIFKGTFTFNGPTGSNTVKITVPPGHHSIDGRTKWNTNGFKGGKDTPGKGGVTCPAEPGFSIVKKQEDEKSGVGNLTTSPISGQLGEEVRYKIFVTNTGNTTLKFSNFTDEKCSPASGGPGESAVAPGETTIYSCDHFLVPADEPAYSNTATDTGTPPEGEGSPVTNTSNTVVVEPIT